MTGGIAAFHGPAVSPSCGYCLKASMTGRVGWFGLVHPLLPVSGIRTGFDPLPSRERDSVGWFYRRPALWILP